MKQFFFVLLLFFYSTNLLHAQEKNGKISGIVKDETGKALDGATVTLNRAKDGGLAKVTVSNKQGIFEFEKLATGNYIINISVVGFNKFSSQPIEINGSNSVEVPAIEMKRGTKALAEATVVGKRPLIENKIDRTVVNVEAAPTNAGATALEVLEKSPGITVDNDGNISLKGKQGVIVMMDGKPTYLSATDLANLLRNLPASALDQIEIMPNPPARFDASGNSGVINIKTKKSRADGFNGSITTGGTVSLYKRNNSWLTPFRQTSSVNFNLRQGKINVFGNFNYNYREGKSNLELDRNFYDKNGTLASRSYQTTEFNGRNNNYGLKLGIDYYANKKNVFGIVLNGFGFWGYPHNTSNQVIYRPDGSIESTLKSDIPNEVQFLNGSANFNYKHNFDSAGREITFDLDYIGYSNTSTSLLTTNVFDEDGIQQGGLMLRGDIPGTINIYSVKSDYVHPLKKDMRFEAGFKSSFVQNDNEVDYQRGNNGSWVKDSRSNHFVYDENINAAYATLNKKWKKFGAQLGLRVENTIAKGHQVTNDSTFKRNYTNVFPTAYVNYEVDKKNSLTLSYGRRIARPNYQDLNPFTWFLDSLTFRQGNPYLMPQFAHNFELRHAFMNQFTTTLNYTITNDVISQILKQNTEQRITYLTTDNVAKFRNIGIAINAPVKPAKWWNSNIFVNVFNNKFTGSYFNSFSGKNDPIDLEYTSFMVNVTNTFTFKKGFSGEISGFYRGKSIEQLSISQPMYFMGFGLQKQVMKGNGTIRMNVRDPFHWQQYRGRTRYSDIDVKIHNMWDNRNLTVTFSYRFGKNTVAQARKRNSATNEEQNRAGGGQQ
jgi:iron complex outermembrane recepter protein